MSGMREGDQQPFGWKWVGCITWQNWGDGGRPSVAPRRCFLVCSSLGVIGLIRMLVRRLLLVCGIGVLAVWGLSYRNTLYVRQGAVTNLPMVTLACSRGELRVEWVHNIPATQAPDVDGKQRFGCGYVVLSAPGAMLHDDGVSVFSATSDFGCIMPYELLMTAPPAMPRQPQRVWECWFIRIPLPPNQPNPPPVRFQNVRFSRLYAPAWAPTILLSSYPLGWLAWRFARRHRRGLDPVCVDCSYDLTDNVSGVCSECGRPIEPTARSI